MVNLENGASTIAKVGGAFVSVLLNRLYYLVAIPAMVVAYNVYKALDAKDDQGKSIFDKISDIITEAVNDVTDVSNQCPALIGDFSKFLDCLGF